MKVIYEDPDGREGTYHPQLGYLKSGKPFNLPDEIALLYVRSGLLKEAKKLRTEKVKEVEDGNTDNRP